MPEQGRPQGAPWTCVLTRLGWGALGCGGGGTVGGTIRAEGARGPLQSWKEHEPSPCSRGRHTVQLGPTGGYILTSQECRGCGTQSARPAALLARVVKHSPASLLKSYLIIWL